jgi:hypothetical protein
MFIQKHTLQHIFLWGSIKMVIDKPEAADRAAIKMAYKHLCEGVPFEKLKLTAWQDFALKEYMRSASEGRSVTQISQDIGWSAALVADLKDIKSLARRNNKKKLNKKVPTLPLSDVLRMRLAGQTWTKVKQNGGTSTQVHKLTRFLSELKKGTSAEEIKGIVYLSNTEFKNLVKVVKENQKIKAV